MFFIALQLSKLAGATPTHPIINYVNKGPLQVFLLYVVACVWAPISEETMFRGALFADLRARYSWLISAPIVGFVFAAVHPQGPTLIPALGGIGVAFCGLREWRGSLIASMTAHALNNGTVMTILVLTMN
jgi:membrane protease YdiL (CAAX protease family)